MLNEILNDLKEGKIVCLADTPDLENEIDMMCLACKATPENIGRMIAEARGLVCCALSAEIVDKMGLEKIESEKISEDRLGTPFFMPLDLNNGSTGVSAVERSKTAMRLATGEATLDEFVAPGHLMTLRARPGLLKERLGHTEFSVALAKMCGVEGAAVICEMIKDNGEMMRVKDFEEWNKDKGLKLYSMTEFLEVAQ